MTPLGPQSGALTSDRIVSPELALVDPTLAAEERARLSEPPPAPPATWRGAQPDGHDALRALAAAALVAREPGASGDEPRRVTPLTLAAVAGATVVALLLLHVQVEVGRSPAGTEGIELVPPVSNNRPQEPPAGEVQPPRRTSAAKPSARRFAWAPVANADSYRVELFRGSRRVFAATSREAQLTVPVHWIYEGKRRTLTRGNYSWYVWPIRSGKRAPNAIVQATVTVP